MLTSSRMAQPQHIGSLDVCKRELYFLSLPDLTSMPDSIPMPSRFVAFLAANTNGIDAAVLGDFSRKLRRAGCVYFCAWGADCERVHDAFDFECLDAEPVIMTTWHSKDSLDEALWFFVFNAYPDDGYSDSTRSALTISIGSPAWDEQIRKRLADVHSLNRDMVDESISGEPGV
jgi:hypothetical protein